MFRNLEIKERVMSKLLIVSLLQVMLLLSVDAYSAMGVHLVADDISISRVKDVDPRCPPINTSAIAAQLKPVFNSGSASSKVYRLDFAMTGQFDDQVQAYIQYLHTVNTKIHTLSTVWRIYDKGVSHSQNPPLTPGLGKLVAESRSRFHYAKGASSNNMAAGFPLIADRWYRVLTWSQLNNDIRYFPGKCETAQYWISWRFGKSGAKHQTSAGELVLSDGRRILAVAAVRKRRAAKAQ